MLYSKSYGFGDKDPNIVSGFLSAMSSFARELDEGELKSINMHKHIVLMSMFQKLCFTVFLDQEDDENQGRLILETLMNAFLSIFPELDPQTPVELGMYRGFDEILDELFLIKNVYEVVESTTKLLTLIEVQKDYKKLFGLNIDRPDAWKCLTFLVKNNAIVEVKRERQILYRKKGELLKGLSQGLKKGI